MRTPAERSFSHGRGLADGGADEVVEVGLLDRRRDAVGEGGHPQAPVGILGRTNGEERLEQYATEPGHSTNRLL